MRSVRHQSALGWWQMAFADPHPVLTGLVRRYCGWEEQTAAPLWRVEPPGPAVPVIILFASPVLVSDTPGSAGVRSYGSFVAGLCDRHTVVGSGGRMAGVQVDCSPLGARLLFDRPLSPFANRMVELDDVWGADARRLTERLAEARSWEQRFAILDRELAARLADATPPHGAIRWAIERLLATDGQVSVAALAREAGWSRRHLIDRMRHEFGLTPKTLGRVLRLGHAVAVLKREGDARLAEVAADCGYYDQAHFTRDFRAFTGTTPGAFLKSRLPDDGGVAAT